VAALFPRTNQSHHINARGGIGGGTYGNDCGGDDELVDKVALSIKTKNHQTDG
jgi:hypothetical protein